MSNSIFAVVINCMDGRIQKPVNRYIEKNYNFRYVDLITEAGPVSALSRPVLEDGRRESIQNKLDISINVHGSKHVFLVAHDDCAGNPLGKDYQLLQLRDSAKLINSWYANLKVTLLWADLSSVSKEWTVKEV